MNDRIYAGEVVRLPATPATLALVEAARAALVEALGDLGEPRRVQHHLTAEAFLDRLAGAREAVADLGLSAVLEAAGLAPGEHVADRLRLRAVLSGGHHHPDAAAAYVAHRDTWYANPRAQVNWWIPVWDVPAEAGFDVYPDALGVAVANDSERFDLDAFLRRAGWQARRRVAGVPYPAATHAWPDRAVRVHGRTGEAVLFAGAHLHQTARQDTGRTRFSLELRTVHVGDLEAGRGAPCVDDRSRGRAVDGYRRVAS